MSSKINVAAIVKGHVSTICDSTGRWLWSDFITFFFLPVVVASLCVSAGFNLTKDLTSLLVNFGSIFTALLMSVVVLVSGQESKLEEKAAADRERNNPVDVFFNAKIKLLNQLYHNITFSMLCSLLLVFLCFVFSVSDSYLSKGGSWVLAIQHFVLTPLILFVLVSLLLTVLMIVKRWHSFLTHAI